MPASDTIRHETCICGGTIAAPADDWNAWPRILTAHYESARHLAGRPVVTSSARRRAVRRVHALEAALFQARRDAGWPA